VKPLLAELHAHTTWSDGDLSVSELVDLYGAHGFDVLCVTDHAVRAAEGMRVVGVPNWRGYLDELEAQARRAARRDGLLLIPGLELTENHADPLRSAHALAIGLRSFVSVELGLRDAVDDARRAGAAIVAAHPHAPGENSRGTCRWWHERDAPVIRPDRYELFNRRDVFAWVAERDLPCIATGDFHRAEHFESWKTLLPCAHNEDAVVAFLRSPARAYLIPFSGERRTVVERAAA
jgi:predicted metal-dependent phosphoesterase TrpH